MPVPMPWSLTTCFGRGEGRFIALATRLGAGLRNNFYLRFLKQPAAYLPALNKTEVDPLQCTREAWAPFTRRRLRRGHVGGLKGLSLKASKITPPIYMRPRLPQAFRSLSDCREAQH